MFRCSGYEVWPLPNHCLPLSPSLTQSVTKEIASMAEWGWLSSFRHTVSTAGELSTDGFEDKVTFPSVQLFLMSRHYSLRGSPLISWQFNIKEYKMIISPSSACLLLCIVNRGSTSIANGVKAEPFTATKYLSSITSSMQGIVLLSNYAGWVILLALGIMF